MENPTAVRHPQMNRLTRTHATFTRDQIAAWPASRGLHSDGGDRAVIRIADGA